MVLGHDHREIGSVRREMVRNCAELNVVPQLPAGDRSSGDRRQSWAVVFRHLSETRRFAEFQIALGYRDVCGHCRRLDALLGKFQLRFCATLVIIEIQGRVTHDTLHTGNTANRTARNFQTLSGNRTSD